MQNILVTDNRKVVKFLDFIGLNFATLSYRMIVATMRYKLVIFFKEIFWLYYDINRTH